MKVDHTDEALVAAVRRGEVEAFGVLIDRHRGPLLRQIRRLAGSAEEAEDIAQEALLRAFLDLGALRDPDRFGSWLTTIALNLARMSLRRQGRWTEAVPSGPDDERTPAADSASPEEDLERRAAARRAATALATLPERDRQVVVLHDLDGLSCPEIAAQSGQTAGAVRVRLHRARRTLRVVLRPDVRPTSKEMTPMREVTVRDVQVRVFDDETGQGTPLASRLRVVLLEEIGGGRLLPIWIGPSEGDALALQLAGTAPLRPFTVDLTARLLAATGGRIGSVEIRELRGDIYVATVQLAAPPQELDARPSDALNLALRVGAPVFVDESLLLELPADLGIEALLDRQRLTVDRHPERGPSTWRSLTPALVAADAP